MDHILETLFLVGGTILFWGKIAGYLLSLGLTLFICNRLIKWATPTFKGALL